MSVRPEDRIEDAPSGSSSTDPAVVHRHAEGAPGTPPYYLRRKRRRGHKRWWLAAVIVLALALLDGGYVAVGLRSAHARIVPSLSAAASALSKGRLVPARNHLIRARRDARAAVALTDHPSLQLAGILPVIEHDANAVKALSAAAHRSTQAGLRLVKAARAAGPEQGLVSAFYQRGRVRFEPIERAQPYVADGALLMERVSALLERAPKPSTPWVQDALATARQWGRSTRDTARQATTLLEILPDFLGQGDRRRYLLAFQTPGEARGTGGLMGFYGVLGVTDGRVRLERVGSVQELMDEPITGVQAPGWFRRRYRLAGSFDYWQQANLSPNFPVVASMWLQMYRSTTGQSLDGVLAMDPIALGHLLHATGPLRAKGIDVTVGPHNAKDVLLHDSYVNFGEDTEAQRNYIERLIRQFWHRLAEGAIDPAALAQGTAESVRTKHFKVYTRADDDDDELRELGVDGDYTALGPNLQLIFHNSYASNKVDYFLEQRIHTSVRLASSGTADVTTTTVLDNRAPSAPSSSLLGPGQIKSDTVGINRSTLEFLLPRGAKVRSFAVEGKRVRPVVDYEAGFPVAWKLVEVPAGKSKRVTVSYTIPEALTPPQDGSDFSMSLVPQTTVNPPSFSLTVVPPYGYELEPVQGATTTSGGIRTSGILDQEQTLRARLRAR